MSIPLFDLKSQYLQLKSEIDQAIAGVVESHGFILGDGVKRLERQLAEYCGTRYALGVSSGTDALLMVLWALGIQPGDEIITTPYTFVATVGAAMRLGAVPVFVDIEHDTFNLDPVQVEAAFSPRTRAILPVHIFGACADMSRLNALAAANDVPVVEDAAQAIGATHQGARAGSLGLAGCFSLFPTKNLGGFGDGGFITTDDSELLQNLAELRTHGSTHKGDYSRVGGNFRLDALQAAIVEQKLTLLDSWNERRARLATRYRERIAARGLLDDGFVTSPAQTDERHVYHLFVCRFSSPEVVCDALNQRGIGCRAYYKTPLHLQPALRGRCRVVGELRQTELAADQGLALPIFPHMRDEQVDEVVDVLARVRDGSAG